MAIKAHRERVTVGDIPIVDEIVLEFSGEHYLPKRKVREVFGWDEDTVCDLEENFLKYGHFVTLAGANAFYHDKIQKRKSVIVFYSSHVDIEKFKDLSWLEKRVLTTQN